MALDNIEHIQIVPGTHITVGPLPNRLGLEVDELVASIEKDNFSDPGEAANPILAGHIQKEFKIPLDSVSNGFKGFLSYNAALLNERIPENKAAFTEDSNIRDSLKLDSFWVNFQAKYEFNPPHKHSGLYSFVIWNRIPYDVKEEHDRFKDLETATNTVCASSFSFLVPYGGTVHSYLMHVDKSTQNYICMFPSTLTHCVFPFYTSDEYRVSLSGNLYVK